MTDAETIAEAKERVKAGGIVEVSTLRTAELTDLITRLIRLAERPAPPSEMPTACSPIEGHNWVKYRASFGGIASWTCRKCGAHYEQTA